MTKEELRKRIADKLLDWAMSGELTKALDGEALPTDTISITIEVKGIARRCVKLDFDKAVASTDLVIAVRTRVDGKDGSQQLGHGRAAPGTYAFIEVSATP